MVDGAREPAGPGPRTGVWLFAAQGTTRLVSFVVFAAVAHRIDARGLGALTIATAVAGAAVAVAPAIVGKPIAVARDEQQRRLFGRDGTSATVFASLLVAIALAVAAVFTHDLLRLALAGGAVGLPATMIVESEYWRTVFVDGARRAALGYVAAYLVQAVLVLIAVVWLPGRSLVVVVFVALAVPAVVVLARRHDLRVDAARRWLTVERPRWLPYLAGTLTSLGLVQVIPIVLSAAAGFQAAGTYRAGELAFGGTNLLIGVGITYLLTQAPERPFGLFVRWAGGLTALAVLNGAVVALLPRDVLHVFLGSATRLLIGVLLVVTVQRVALAVSSVGNTLLTPRVPPRVIGVLDVVSSAMSFAALVIGAVIGGARHGLEGGLIGLAAAEVVIAVAAAILLLRSRAPAGGAPRGSAGTGSVRIGLAVSTIGRAELAALLESAARSTLPPVAVAIADQSHGRLLLDAAAYPFPVVVLPSSGGVGAGRNDALRALPADVELVGFPNDDGRYRSDTLALVAQRLRAEQAVPVTGSWPAAVAATYVASDAARGLPAPGTALDRASVWRAAEPALFVTRRAFDAVGDFRADLGTGAASPWQSGEGTELLLRVLAAGGRVVSAADVVVDGPGERRDLDPGALVAKHRRYARGTGYVYRLHAYPRSARLRIVLGPWREPFGFHEQRRTSLRIAWARSAGRVEGLRGHARGTPVVTRGGDGSDDTARTPTG